MFSAHPLPARIASAVTASLFSLVLVAAFAPALKAQDDQVKPPAYIDDWTHHRLVYSNPGTREDAERQGRLDQWLKITRDTRFQLQQFKRSGGPRQVGGHRGEGGGLGLGWNHGGGSGRTPYKKFTDLMEKDWSTALGSGVGASFTGAVGTLNGTSITGSSILTVDGVAFHASAPTAASQTGTFTGNPANGQTVTVAGTALTASLSSPASGSIILSSGGFCFAPNTGVIVGSTTFTTNANVGTGSYSVGSTLPSPGDQVMIGGVSYVFESTLSGTTPANQVLIGTFSGGNSSQDNTARNLSVAINNTGTCGSTSGGVCTRNVTAINKVVTASNTAGQANETLTALCAGNALITGTSDGTKLVVNNVSAATSQGTNSANGRTFAIGTYIATATNIFNDINGNTTSSASFTATNPSNGVVDISVNTWGTAGNTDTLALSASSTTSNVTIGAFAGGTDGTNSGTSFAVDNVKDDNATNLAAAITRSVTGFTGASSTTVVTVTDSTPGTGGNAVPLVGLSSFTWTGANLSGGTDGTTSGTTTPPTFAYWSGASYTTPAQVASNIAAAVNARPSFSGVLTASSTGSGITFTAAPGDAGNAYTVSASGFSAYTGTGTFSGGLTATVQPNASPAKYGPSLTTASCTADFVVYPTGQPGSATAASIIAYSNIYSSCGGNVPTTYWAFNTESGANTGYTVTTSPTLSYDGTKIAFVQSNGTASELVVLKWIGASGTLTAPTAPTISADIATCTAPCMTVTPLTNNDTYSSPYYAYYSVDDSIFVGDDSGSLEEFNNVFNGAIAGPQTVNLGNTYPLASPVYDLVSGCVFAGDTSGYFYSANSGTPGTVCTATSFSTRGHSELLSDGGAGGGIYDAPLVDIASGAIYVFVASNAASTTTVTANEARFSTTLTGTGGAGGMFTTAEDGKAISGTSIPFGDTITATGVNTVANTARLTTASNCGSFGGCGPYTFTFTLANGGFNAVDQFTTSTIGAGINNAAPAATQEVGTGGDGYPLFAGALDNVYYSSTNEASPNGNLYVIGNTGVTTGATLYRLPITNGTLGAPSTAVAGLTPSGAGAYPWPSPLTEFCNGGGSACTASGGATTVGTDYIFFSVNQGNVPRSCTGGAGNTCIESYTINSPSTILIQGAYSYTNPSTNGCWGTGGIVIDNDDATTTGASEIYFISLNGATAGGGAGGGTATSTSCTTSGAPTINAIQAQQANP